MSREELRIERSNGPHSNQLRAIAVIDGVETRISDIRYTFGSERQQWINSIVQVPNDYDDVRVTRYLLDNGDGPYIELRFGHTLVLFDNQTWMRVLDAWADSTRVPVVREPNEQ